MAWKFSPEPAELDCGMQVKGVGYRTAIMVSTQFSRSEEQGSSDAPSYYRKLAGVS